MGSNDGGSNDWDPMMEIQRWDDPMMEIQRWDLTMGSNDGI